MALIRIGAGASTGETKFLVTDTASSGASATITLNDVKAGTDIIVSSTSSTTITNISATGATEDTIVRPAFSSINFVSRKFTATGNNVTITISYAASAEYAYTCAYTSI